MKKSRQETAETRNRILELAAKELRRHGITGFGIADLMSMANLTHGGFYRHFDSRDQLVREAFSLLMDRVGDTTTCDAQETGTNPITRIADQYLSEKHLEDRADGCPFAALGGDVARAEDDTRHLATEGFLDMIGKIAERLGDRNDEALQKKAIVAFCSMVGAMTMARMVDDKALAETILTQMKNHLDEM